MVLLLYAAALVIAWLLGVQFWIATGLLVAGLAVYGIVYRVRHPEEYK
jgi:hypothetical protein